MHDGHWERIRRRIIAEGTDGFEEHQLLEALLFYSIPRSDTNETAHRLIEEFGSLTGVFSASYEELLRVFGIGESSALLIRLVAGINRKIALSENSREGQCFDSLSKICKYLANLYVGINVERVYLMMFDNSMRLIDCARICDGTVNTAVMLPRLMIEKALLKHASNVVVAHNHPNGVAVPSSDDISTTEMLRAAFDLVRIQMLEHVVIAGKNYAPIMRGRNFENMRVGMNAIVENKYPMINIYDNPPDRPGADDSCEDT